MGSLLKFLADLSQPDALYDNSWTCQAIFRSLPPLAKQIILRLLYVPDEVSFTSLRQCLVNKERPLNEYEEWIHLVQLHIVLETVVTRGSKRRKFVSLNERFQTQLQIALSSSSLSPWVHDLHKGKERPSQDKLVNFSRISWERILRFILGHQQPNDKDLSEEIVQLIKQTGLMESEGSEFLVATRKGYQFLLQRPYQQVWTLLQSYLMKSSNQSELLSFLFQISFLTVGEEYSVEVLSGAQQQFVRLLREFGLIYQNHRGSKRYYPTQLAISLATGQEPVRQEGYIIVETNFRVYAYCKSPLLIHLLSLFVSLKYRLPNLVFGFITRRSIRDAFVQGISAEDIISYLDLYAHPEAKKHEYPVPEALADQIRLWERERNVVSCKQAVLLENFRDKHHFEEVKAALIHCGLFLWADDDHYRYLVGQCSDGYLIDKLMLDD